MTTVLSGVCILLLLSLVLGLLRIWRGPGIVERMLAAQLFGSTGVALLLVLATLQQAPSIRNVALVLALLAALAVLAFVARVWHAKDASAAKGEDDEPA